MTERRVTRLALLVDQHRMTLRECAALGILSRKAHAMAIEQQRAERERLACRPVDALAGLARLAAVVEKALDRAVHVETIRHRGDLSADLLQLRERHAG